MVQKAAKIRHLVTAHPAGGSVPRVLPAQPASLADWVIAGAEWFSAVGTVGALVIGLVILARDHRNAERAQVDRVGVWAEPTYERRPPPAGPRVEQAKIKVYIRNASDLPVDVKQVKYTIRTRWWVPSDDGASERVDGTLTGPYFLFDFQIRPGETWDNKGTSYEVNLAHTAPEGAVQLDFLQGVQCEISSVVVLDNAGRKWDIRPGAGGRAKRLSSRDPRREGGPAQLTSRITE
jgi:hypothetical protein